MAASSVAVNKTGGISATDTTIPFDTAVQSGAQVGALITSNDEQMRVTANDGTNLTVVRGVNGTTAVAHADDAVLTVLNYNLGNLRLTIVGAEDDVAASHTVSSGLDAIIIQGRGAGVRMAFASGALGDNGDYFYIGGNMPVSFAVSDLSGKTLHFVNDSGDTAWKAEIMEILRGQA
tara:strand:- start:257 stop:787 length:531 start_codon:yes stop_codon:yes gene_type:complete